MNEWDGAGQVWKIRDYVQIKTLWMAGLCVISVQQFGKFDTNTVSDRVYTLNSWLNALPC